MGVAYERGGLDFNLGFVCLSSLYGLASHWVEAG